MDRRKSFLNVGVSVSSKIVLMVLVIVVKRFLIDYCGNEMNGLNALYISIIGFLSVAELGVGSAITFCMYKPIVEGNHSQVSALYVLFKKAYFTIGAIIFVLGLCLMPFLKSLAKDYAELDTNLYLTFFIMLISVVLTYLFSAEVSLINAYKNNYITTAITSAGMCLQYILQITVLIITRSFIGYLLCRIVAVLFQWALTKCASSKKYDHIIKGRYEQLNKEIKVKLINSIKAMFMHKIGYVLVNTVDSVVISAFVGVVALGGYSNYTMFSTTMVGVISLLFTSLTSVIGHLCAKEDGETLRKYCDAFYIMNFIVGIVFFLGYYAIVDDLISLFFSETLVADGAIPFVITVNGFVQFMRSGVTVFRDATGTFYNDRWKPLAEGITNIVLSVILVHYIGVVGVIVATILTNLLICHIVEPYVLYKNAFCLSPGRYYFKNYILIGLFIVSLVVFDALERDIANAAFSIIVNGFLSVGISLIVSLLVVMFNRSSAALILKFFKGEDESVN